VPASTDQVEMSGATFVPKCLKVHSSLLESATVLVSLRAAAVPCERLVGQDRKGGDRDGHLDDDRADRQEPNFALGLRVHGLPNAEGQGSIRAYRKSFGLQFNGHSASVGGAVNRRGKRHDDPARYPQYKCVHGYPDTTKRMAQPMNQINTPIRTEIPIPVRSAPWVNTLASMIAVRPTAATMQTQ
jgi:hypothetical protein